MNVYIIVAVFMVIIVSVYFLFLKKEKNDNKTPSPSPSPSKSSNIRIALQAVGLNKENFGFNIEKFNASASKPTEPPIRMICDRTVEMVYGTATRKGFIDVYRDIMKTDFVSVQKPNCNALDTRPKIDAEFTKLAPLFSEPMVKAIENGQNGYQDVVALWIFITYGLIYVYNADMSSSSINIQTKPNGEIDTIELVSSGTVLTPAWFMSFIERMPENPPTPVSIAAKAKVTPEEINQLKSDTNPKMTVPTLAKALIVWLAKRGSFN